MCCDAARAAYLQAFCLATQVVSTTSVLQVMLDLPTAFMPAPEIELPRAAMAMN